MENAGEFNGDVHPMGSQSVKNHQPNKQIPWFRPCVFSAKNFLGDSGGFLFYLAFLSSSAFPAELRGKLDGVMIAYPPWN